MMKKQNNSSRSKSLSVATWTVAICAGGILVVLSIGFITDLGNTKTLSNSESHSQEYPASSLANQLEYAVPQDTVDCSRYSLELLSTETLRPDEYLNLDENATSTMASMLNDYFTSAYGSSSYRYKYASFPSEAFDKFQIVDNMFSDFDSDGKMDADESVALDEAFSSALPKTYIVIAKDDTAGYVTSQDFQKIVSRMRQGLGSIFQDQNTLSGTADKISKVISETAGDNHGELSVNIDIGDHSLLSYGNSYVLTYAQMNMDFNSSSKDVKDMQHSLQLLLHFNRSIYAVYAYSPIEDREGFQEISQWFDQLVLCIKSNQ